MSFQCELQTHLCARLGLYALKGELYPQANFIPKGPVFAKRLHAIKTVRLFPTFPEPQVEKKEIVSFFNTAEKVFCTINAWPVINSNGCSTSRYNTHEQMLTMDSLFCLPWPWDNAFRSNIRLERLSASCSTAAKIGKWGRLWLHMCATLHDIWTAVQLIKHDKIHLHIAGLYWCVYVMYTFICDAGLHAYWASRIILTLFCLPAPRYEVRLHYVWAARSRHRSIEASSSVSLDASETFTPFNASPSLAHTGCNQSAAACWSWLRWLWAAVRRTRSMHTSVSLNPSEKHSPLNTSKSHASLIFNQTYSPFSSSPSRPFIGCNPRATGCRLRLRCVWAAVRRNRSIETSVS